MEFYTKEETTAQHEEIVKTLTAVTETQTEAFNIKIAGLATKEQAEEILLVFETISKTLKITQKGAQGIYRAVLYIAPFIVAITVIWSFFKGGLAKFYP